MRWCAAFIDRQTDRQTVQYDSSMPTQQARSTYRLHTEALHVCYEALAGPNCSVRRPQPFGHGHGHGHGHAKVQTQSNCCHRVSAYYR